MVKLVHKIWLPYKKVTKKTQKEHEDFQKHTARGAATERNIKKKLLSGL